MMDVQQMLVNTPDKISQYLFSWIFNGKKTVYHIQNHNTK